MLKTILTLLCALLILNSQAQNASDTIKIRKDIGRVYIYNGMKLKPKHLLSIMEPNPAAYSEMKRAKTNMMLVLFLVLQEAFLLAGLLAH